MQFFEKRGFEVEAAASVSTVLLQQSKIDDVPVFKLLDTLKGLTDVQISGLVAEILNYNRPKSSSIGYRIKNATNWAEARNIDLPENLAGVLDTSGFYIEPGYVAPGYVAQES